MTRVFNLVLRAEYPLSIKVSEDGRPDFAHQISLPISKIKYDKRSNGYVRVEIPEWLAIEKGLL